MAASRRPPAVEGIEQGLGVNPLDGDDPLTDAFYRAPTPRAVPAPPASVATTTSTVPTTASTLPPTASTPPTKAPGGRARGKGRQPLQDGKSFRLVTFSIYEEDVARLDELLREARKLGHRRASRSQIVRLALRQVDLTELPDDV
jgi:hypothetical protein